jgi:hypothetical protein
MAIQVRSASIERPKMLSYGERVEATEDALVIKILVANFSAGKKVDYSSLGTSSGMEFFESVSATDSFGNHLHKLRLGLSAKLEGSADSGSIYPGKSVLDVIALELPVPNAKYVRLQISGSTMGEAKGDFRIQIPASRIKH